MIKKHLCIRVMVLAALIACAGSCFLFSCDSQSNTGDPEKKDGPDSVVTIVMEEKYGNTNVEADGFDSLTFVIKVTHEQTGDPWKNQEVTLTLANGLGMIESPVYTNNQGVAESVFVAACEPGSEQVTACCLGECTHIEIELWGIPPKLELWRKPMNIGAAGSINRVQVSARVRCSEDTYFVGAPITFCSECGCFEHGCDSEIETDVNGWASQLWYPRLGGTNSDHWSDYNAPLSCNLKATYTSSLGNVYTANQTVYVYPLHAKAWIKDVEVDWEDRYIICDDTPPDFNDFDPIPIIAKVWWEDGDGMYPQKDIEVTFSSLDPSSDITNEAGEAKSFITPHCNCSSWINNPYDYSDYTYDTIVVKIEETSTVGDCCQGENSSGWTWEETLNIVYVEDPLDTNCQ